MGLALEVAVTEQVAVTEGQLVGDDGDGFRVEAGVLQAGTLSAQVVNLFHSVPKVQVPLGCEPWV